MTLALDASHDLFLGSRAGVATVSGGEAVAQRLLTRLRLFRGEWFLDVNAGTPWFQTILADRADIRSIELELKRQITETPGVVSILSFAVDFNRSTRSLSISFEVDTPFGPSGVLEVAQ